MAKEDRKRKGGRKRLLRKAVLNREGVTVA